MQPYQKASEVQRSSGEYPINIIKNLGLSAVGGGVAKLGSQAVSKLIPGVAAFLSEYIPDNLSQKGLSKLDPRFGKFIQGAIDEGYSYEDLRGFMGDKIKKEQPAKEDRNIIQQYSPELHQFIDQQVKSGRKPIEAAAIAQQDKKFSNIIKKLSKDHKTNWSQIVESIYGGMGQAQPQQAQQQPQEQMQGQQQAPQQAQGQGQQALMAILQKIQQARGGQ